MNICTFYFSVVLQFSSANNQTHAIVESYEGTGISPFVSTHNSVTLAAGWLSRTHFDMNVLTNWTSMLIYMSFWCLSAILDGDLYSAVPLDPDGSSLQFRRKAGGRTNVWMYDGWLSGGLMTDVYSSCRMNIKIPHAPGKISENSNDFMMSLNAISVLCSFHSLSLSVVHVSRAKLCPSHIAATAV